jgi:septal ring-binding cell division protein DamX
MPAIGSAATDETHRARGPGMPAANATTADATAALPPLQAPAGRGDLIEERLAATRAWLAATDPNAFTIQLMEAEHAPQLVLDLNEIAKFVEINKVFLYRSRASRSASLSVLYGSYSDRHAAQEALDKLPPALRANRPFLRTVRGVRAEIGQQQAS